MTNEKEWWRHWTVFISDIGARGIYEEALPGLVEEVSRLERQRILKIVEEKIAKVDEDPENEDGNAIDRTYLAGMRSVLVSLKNEIEKI